MIRSEPCTLAHIRAIIPLLRDEDRIELASAALAPRHVLIDLWRNSYFSRSYFVDGEIAAVFGCTGTFADEAAEVWLLTTFAVERVPIGFFREASRVIDDLLKHKRVLTSAILSSHGRALRTYRMLGFSVEAPRQFGDTPLEFCRITLGRDGHRPVPRKANAPPFIVYALPRSRTAWLSAFLSYGDWLCFHEHAMFMRDVADLKAFFARPRTGSVETAAAQGWWLVKHYFPNIRTIVVRRPVDDVMRSTLEMDVAGAATYDPDKLRRSMRYGDRMLEQISAQPNVLTVDFADLDREEACRAVFEHCLPYGFDREWWMALKDQNVQMDVKNMLRYYNRNRGDIDAFKQKCWRELRRLRAARELA